MGILFGGKDTTEKINQSLRREIRFHKRALDCCTKKFPYLSDIKTSLSECYAQIGHNYFRAGVYGEAIDFYKKSLEYNQHHYQARNQLGIIYYRQQKLSESTDCFQEIIKLADNDFDKIHKADALLSLAMICCAYKKPSSFRKAYKYVIKADSLIEGYSLTDEIMRLVMQSEKDAAVKSYIKPSESLFLDKTVNAENNDNTKVGSLEIY